MLTRGDAGEEATSTWLSASGTVVVDSGAILIMRLLEALGTTPRCSSLIRRDCIDEFVILLRHYPYGRLVCHSPRYIVD